jgi:hypothetical protein
VGLVLQALCHYLWQGGALVVPLALVGAIAVSRLWWPMRWLACAALSYWSWQEGLSFEVSLATVRSVLVYAVTLVAIARQFSDYSLRTPS